MGVVVENLGVVDRTAAGVVNLLSQLKTGFMAILYNTDALRASVNKRGERESFKFTSKPNVRTQVALFSDKFILTFIFLDGLS